MHQTLPIVFCSIAVAAGQLLDPNCTAESSRTTRVRQNAGILLGRLGMDRPMPNPTGPVMVPEDIMEAYEAITATKIDDREPSCLTKRPIARKVRVFFPDITTIPFHYYQEYYYHYGHSNVKVNIPPIIYQLKIPLNLTEERMITSAELIFRAHIASYRWVLEEHETIRISLVYNKKAPHHRYYKQVKEIILTKLIKIDDNASISFNVTKGLKRWLEINKEGIGIMKLEVAIVPPCTFSYVYLPPVLEFDTSFANRTQFIVMSIQQEQMKRKKRQTLDGDFCFGSPDEPNCCIRELTIDFEKDLGWTWILCPTSYQANYCVGLCPVLWPSASFATELFQIYAENNPGGPVQPCCSTEERSSLTLMLLDDNDNVKLTKLSDMIIHSCICR